MTQDIWRQSLGEFIEATASDAPAPGGGSVAAVSGALGLGLVLMALNVTAKGKNPPPGIADLIGRARALLAELREAPAADIDAFSALMGAYRLPKESEAEQEIRRAAIATATVRATETPLAAAGLCARALELAAEAAACAKPSILSDVEAGALLLRGAGDAVLLNVDINLPALAEDAVRGRFAAERKAMAARLAARAAAVSETLKARAA